MAGRVRDRLVHGSGVQTFASIGLCHGIEHALLVYWRQLFQADLAVGFFKVIVEIWLYRLHSVHSLIV